MKHLPAAAVAAESSESAKTPSLCPFAEVAPALRPALERRGFTALTLVQRTMLEAAAEGRDLQISSQTGSGKTVALGLALAERLLHARSGSSPRALVICPTRELATQVRGELEWLYADLAGIRVESVTGGSSVFQEKRRLAGNPAVVVGTPGRLLDHIRSGALDCSKLEELALDEADRMLDMGFREELEAILDATPATRRTHLMSATFPPDIRRLAKKYQQDPVTVEGTKLGAANEDIEHVGHLVRRHDLYAAIVNLLLLGDDERTLIFVSTRAQAGELAAQLSGDGFAAAPISGELEQNQRTRTLDAFRSGATSILVATDVAARGLDIPDVSLVIHTDAPFDSESYTHRAGRTGRAGRKGRSVLLATPMRQKKVEMLLSRANVKLAWREVPTAAVVEKMLAKRERRRLREALSAGQAPAAASLVFAQSLLEQMEPGELVARLLERCRDPRQAAPLEIEPMQPHAARGDRRAERPEWKNRPEPRSRAGERQRDRRDDTRGERRPVRHDARGEARPASQAERFEINWGLRAGATPERIVAMLCRRGDVRGSAIGTIDIDTFTTTFEIASEAARDFARNAAQPDARDPKLFIRRAKQRRGHEHPESAPDSRRTARSRG